MHLGTPERRQYVACGPSVAALARMDSQAKAGEIYFSPEARRQIVREVRPRGERPSAPAWVSRGDGYLPPHLWQVPASFQGDFRRVAVVFLETRGWSAPGLESFAQHELSKRQASGFGAMLWFEVEGGLAAGKKLMDNIELWTLAENLGSVESLITHPVTMTHADVEPEERARVGIIDGLVRASVGLEDTEDLIQALADALDQV